MDFSEFISDLQSFLSENGYNDNHVRLIKNAEIINDNINIYCESSDDKNKISEFSSKIRDFLKKKYKSDYRITIIVKEDTKIDINKNQDAVTISQDTSPKSRNNFFGNPLNEIQTFSSFVVGDNSRFAYYVCQAISKNPGLNYNPCLLHGGVGLGKTHLAQAVGNEISKNLGLRICYMNCDTFLKEYGEAVASAKINEYKEKFNNIDVWIVDDIQFLENKSGMQEGFFSIFNSLRDKNKQILCTSDRPTNALKKFEPRLSSRIASGITATLKAPNEETRYAILKRKFAEQNFLIDEKYIKYISENVITNVRALESTVKNIVEYSNLLNEEISMDMIKEAIEDKIVKDEKENEKINGNLIIETVIDVLNANKKDIMSKKRTKGIVFQRDCCAYLMNTLTEMTNTEIGIMLGGRDHATIVHSISKMKELYQNDKKTRSIIDNLKEEIRRKSL